MYNSLKPNISNMNPEMDTYFIPPPPPTIIMLVGG